MSDISQVKVYVGFPCKLEHFLKSSFEIAPYKSDFDLDFKSKSKNCCSQ